MSGRARIAPVLSALLEDLEDLANGVKPHPKASKEGDRRVIRLAKADLRNLLAVVTAAERAEILHQHKGAAGTNKRCAGCKLMAALARLERAGGKK